MEDEEQQQQQEAGGRGVAVMDAILPYAVRSAQFAASLYILFRAQYAIMQRVTATGAGGGFISGRHFRVLPRFRWTLVVYEVLLRP